MNKNKICVKKPFDYSQELFALSLCVMSISDDDDDCGRLSNGMISVRQVQSNRIQREKKKLKFNQIRNLTVVSIPHNWLLLFLMSQSTSCGHSLNFWYFCVWSFFLSRFGRLKWKAKCKQFGIINSNAEWSARIKCHNDTISMILCVEEFA